MQWMKRKIKEGWTDEQIREAIKDRDPWLTLYEVRRDDPERFRRNVSKAFESMSAEMSHLLHIDYLKELRSDNREVSRRDSSDNRKPRDHCEEEW